MSEAFLTVIVNTFNQEDHALPLILHSLVLQTDKRFKVEVWHDGEDDYLRGELQEYWAPMSHDLTFKRRFTEKRLNDFGYTQRNIALASVDTKYICFTGADNYYTPCFVYFFLERMEADNLDFAWCDFLTNYHDCNGNGELPYSVFKSTMNRCRMDISNFVVKTELARQIMFDVTDPRFADGNFVEAFKIKFPEARCDKLAQVLVVHN